MPDRPHAPPAPRLLLAAFVLAGIDPAMALEIEALELRSALGQPLHARARISGAGSERPLSTSIRCLEGACADLRLRTFVAGRTSGAPAVVVRSFSPLRSGFLRIEVEAGNGEEVVRREFSLEAQAPAHRRRLLTDTAGITPPTPAPALPAPDTRRASAAIPPAAPAAGDTSGGSEARVVQPGDTLSGIAASLSRQHGGGTAVWMERLYSANPAAFIRGDRNRIRAGATLRFDLPRATATVSPAEPQAPPPVPEPTAPVLPPAGPAPTMAPAAAGMAATRETLAELADDGKVLADRLATLEARIRTLQAELAGREAAIEELEAEVLARAPAATAPDAAAATEASSPTTDAASSEAASRAQAGDTTPAPAGAVAEAPAAGPDAAATVPEASAQAPALPEASASPTRQPTNASRDWTLIAATGLVALVLGMVLLLRSLSRRSHAGSQPLRRDDHSLKEQIRERLEATEAGADTDPFADADEGFDLRTVQEVAAPSTAEETVRLEASPVITPGSDSAEPRAAVNEDEVVTEVDVKIVYGLFDEAEAVLVEALESAPTSARLLLKLAEVRFYRRDAEALARLAAEVLAQGQRQPAWLWAKIERLGRELCPDREPFAQSPTRPGLRSVG